MLLTAKKFGGGGEQGWELGRELPPSLKSQRLKKRSLLRSICHKPTTGVASRQLTDWQEYRNRCCRVELILLLSVSAVAFCFGCSVVDSLLKGPLKSPRESAAVWCQMLSLKPWLPDGYSQIFRSYVFGPSGFWTMAPLRYATLQNLIPSFPWIAPGWRAWGHNFAIWQPCLKPAWHREFGWNFETELLKVYF